MGLLNVYNQWKETQTQNHIANMKEQGKCPDCQGRGYVIYSCYENVYFSSYECQGCQGSGSYRDWEEHR